MTPDELNAMHKEKRVWETRIGRLLAKLGKQDAEHAATVMLTALKAGEVARITGGEEAYRAAFEAVLREEQP